MTVRLAVLGSPVAHSLSPAIHGAAMAAVGIDGTYSAEEVDEPGMRRMAESVRSGVMLGASITMPHKATAAALADRRTEIAERLGIANTWWREGGELVADATDGAGVRFAWERAGLPSRGRVVVLGAGGAATAAALELSSSHEVTIAARRPDAAADAAGRAGVRVGAWGAPTEGAIVVNGTPIGMAGESLPTWATERATGLLEMVYAAGPTPTMAAFGARGLPVATGLEMLVGQAIPAFERWFGVTAPVEVMLDAAKASSAP